MTVNRPVGICAAFVLALLAIGSSLQAQSPVITAVSPQAVRPGQSVDVTLKGSNLSDPVQLWTSFPCEAVLSPDVKDNGKNSGQVVYRVQVPATAGVGIHGIRLLTKSGVSPVRLLVLDDLPSVPQAAGNHSPSAAQPLTLPVAVDGGIGNLSRDFYKFHADAGQRLSFEVLARRFGSALDPMIRILDLQGHELVYSDDAPGLSADSRLTYTFSSAGDYLIEVRDIRYLGGANYNYRLRIGDFPCVSVPVPMGATRGSQVTLQFAGEDVKDVQPLPVQVPSDPLVASLAVGARRAGGNCSGFVVLSVGSAPEFLETEPNDEAASANRVPFGANLNGRFERPEDVDHFTFTAAKGQQIRLTAVTRSQGSPVDLLLRLLNDKGAKLAEADDAGLNDAQLSFTIPADGEYTLAVQDLLRRGGSEFAYRVLVEATTAAGFELSALADNLNIPAGGTAMITVNAVRQGYNGPISIAAVNLPEGVTSVPTIMGPATTSVVLTLTANASAAAGKLSAVRIEGTAAEGSMKAVASLNDALKASLGNMPWPPRMLADDLALAIAPASKISLRLEPGEVTLGKDLSATVKIIATRAEGFDEAIAFAVTPAKGGVPAGITPVIKPLPKGANEIELVLNAEAAAPLGEFSAVLTATIKQGAVTVTEPVPGLLFRIAEPFMFSIDAGDGKLARGGELKVKLQVERNPAFKGPVDLAFQNLPKGVTVDKLVLAADQSELEVTLKAAPDAPLGEVKNITLKADATAGKAKLTATSGNVAIAVIEP